MGRITVKIPNEVEKEFRVEVTRKYGGEKGSLGRAVAEAMELWLERKKK